MSSQELPAKKNKEIFLLLPLKPTASAAIIYPPSFLQHTLPPKNSESLGNSLEQMFGAPEACSRRGERTMFPRQEPLNGHLA